MGIFEQLIDSNWPTNLQSVTTSCKYGEHSCIYTLLYYCILKNICQVLFPLWFLSISV